MQPAEATGGGIPLGPAMPRHRLGDVARWLAENLIAERERWALWVPVLVGIGIGIYFWLTVEPPLWLGAGAAAGTSAAAVAAIRWQRLILPAIAAAAIALGFAAVQFQAWWVAAPIFERRIGPVAIEGRLVAVDPLPEGTRIIIEPRRIGRLDAAHFPARIRVRLRREPSQLVPGEWLSLKAVLLPPPAPAMPGAYDFQRRAYFDRLGAVGFALGMPQRIAAPPGLGATWWRSAVEAVRATVTQRIRAALPEPTGAIAAALVTGATHAIPPEDAGAFRDAGLAHILVIAGLHMGMVATAAFFGLRALLALIPAIALNHPTKKWAAGLALVVTFLYLLLSGATVPSRRAFCMTGLVLLGVLVDRLSLSARAIAYAALAVMLLTPESAAGPSFQMSFAAVAGLIAFYEAMRGKLSQWHSHASMLRRVGLYVLGIAFTTVITTLATAPFTIYHFNRFPLYSVAANAIAVPITGFWIMPWALVACLLMPFGGEALALRPMGWGIDAVAAIAHWVTSWPGAVLTVPSMPPVALILVSFGGLWLCIWTRRWRWLGLAPIAAGYAALALLRPPDILVAGDSALVAVRAADGSYLLSTARHAKLAEETWTRRTAATAGAAWPDTGVSADGSLSCDALGCLYRHRGRTVALIRDGAALGEDCRHADLVVSPVAAHRVCRGPLVIDRIDTWRKGGHAVWLDEDRLSVETVGDWRGVRPWAPRPVRALRNGAAAEDGARLPRRSLDN
jgi:competence protein ComEC